MAVLPQGSVQQIPLPDFLQCKGVWTFLQNLTRVFFTANIVSTGPADQEMVQEASAKHLYSGGSNVQPYKDSVPSPHRQTPQDSVALGAPGHSLKVKITPLHLTSSLRRIWDVAYFVSGNADPTRILDA